jgi:putative flippase GtrA
VSPQVIRFLVTGGIAAGVNIVARYLLNRVMSFDLSVVVAYMIGMATAYMLARLFVFERSGRSVASEFQRFFIVNMFALGVVWVTSVGLAKIVFPRLDFTWHAEDLAHVIGVLTPAVTSYLGHRSYTFSKTRQTG